MEQILASHPKVKALGERVTLNEAIAEACGAPTIPPSLPQRRGTLVETPNCSRLGALYIKAISRDVLAGRDPHHR